MTTCPCCGQQVAEPSIQAILLSLKFTRSQHHVLAMLAARSPNWVATERLTDSLYADDPDGGPISAAGTVKVFLHQVKAQLAAAGLKAECQWGRGVSERRLVRI